jgi:molybdate transport system substrate-binding protein
MLLNTKWLLPLLLLLPLPLHAETIRVAVASNFSHAMQAISDQFEQQTGHSVDLIFGSTGKIYAQILNGAPFDAFFAADTERPERLEREKRIQPGSRFSYALGQLVLWSPNETLIDSQGNILLDGGFRHLAIANPRLAPYGQAAQQTLEALGVWQQWQDKIVRGENINQTFQYVISGNAELGLLARSQIQSLDKASQGSQWQIPRHLYQPIEQQAVQLTDKPAASALMAFIKSDAASRIIKDFGYLRP